MCKIQVSVEGSVSMVEGAQLWWGNSASQPVWQEASSEGVLSKTFSKLMEARHGCASNSSVWDLHLSF